HALGAIGPGAREAVPALGAALKNSSDAGFRARVALALGRIGESEAAVQPLIEALKDRDENVRLFAVQAPWGLEGQARKSVPALGAVLREDPVAGIRAAAAESLGNLGAEAGGAIPALVDVLLRDDPRDDKGVVRLAAVEALGKIGAAARAGYPALQAV